MIASRTEGIQSWG